MSLFVLDTSGNQELLKADSLTKPKYENSKKRKLLNESTETLGIGNFTAALQSENNEEKKEEYDFFGNYYLLIKVFLNQLCTEIIPLELILL